MKVFCFPKKEHLCAKTSIVRLFEAGNAFVAYPFRVVYFAEKQTDTATAAAVQVLISVPKKKHRRANVRNRLKRLTRESYRLNKHHFVALAQENSINIAVAFQYISDEVLPFNVIERKIQAILNKLTAENNFDRIISP
ncbi:ribonuclease P protein component [Bacteroidia bacterium]|nr:ribonuclease P protein component [Bacteroidia bacterium]